MAILFCFHRYILIKKQEVDGNMVVVIGAMAATITAVVTAVNEEEKKKAI